jgi:hypothetical protein
VRKDAVADVIGRVRRLLAHVFTTISETQERAPGKLAAPSGQRDQVNWAAPVLTKKINAAVSISAATNAV